MAKMKHNGSMLNLWIVRTNGTVPSETTLLARVQDELYVLAFSSAARAASCTKALGAEGSVFYVCNANIEGVVGDARSSDARGFIVDYDPSVAGFESAHPLPSPSVARELR